MSLTKTISAIFTTIGIAIPSALTTWVLTKPKPLKEIDKTIELDEYDEEIDEKEIKPQEAPPTVVVPPIFPIPPLPPSIPPTLPDDAQIDTDQDLQESSTGGEEQDQQSSQPDPILPEEDPVPPETPEPTKEEPEEQKEEDEKEEKPENPEEKEPEDEEEQNVNEIKKSLVEAIGVIIQKYKDGYRIETGGIYDSFDMKQKLEYLVKSIEFLDKHKKQQEAEAAKSGSKEGTPPESP